MTVRHDGAERRTSCKRRSTRNSLAVQPMRVGPWSSRQGRKSGRVKVPSPSIACIGRIAYPVRAEVTKHVLPGSKSLGRPAKFAAVGAIWETSKLGGLNVRNVR